MRTDLAFGTTDLGLVLLAALAIMVVSIFTIRMFMAWRGNQLLAAQTDELKDFSLRSRNKLAALDVNRLRSPFFLLGLILTLGVLVTFLNWETYEEKKQTVMLLDFDDEIEIEVPRTLEPPPPPPPPPPPVTRIAEIPEALFDEDEQVEFIDQSIESETEIYAPPVVTTKKEEAAPPPPPPPPPPEPKVEEIFKVVEEFPRFPGCEDLDASKEEKRRCAEQKMYEFIYSNITYPRMALENNIEGTVIVTFVVEKDGTIANIQILRDVSGNCGKEAVRVVNLMNELPERWSPGKQRGRPVRTQFMLPVKFKLLTKA